MPPVVIGAAIAGTAAVAGSAIAARGARKAAERQASAQERAIRAQETAAERERRERQEAIAKEEARRQEAIDRKIAAARDIKFPTFFELPEAQRLRGRLEERLAGRGLVPPVSPLDINKITAPFAVQRRAGLKQTGTAISSAASARGLGRSTVPVSQIGAASEAAERDIEQRVANLQIENKKIEEANIERERIQIADALARFQAITGREATSQERKALFKRGGEFDIADTIAGSAAAISADEQALAESFKNDQFAIANSIAQQGATEAAFQLRQSEIWASALLGLSKSATQTTDDIIEAINKKQADRNAALVNIGEGTTSHGIDVSSRLVPLR